VKEWLIKTWLSILLLPDPGAIGRGISYTEHNVAQDREKAQEMIKKSGQMGVPVITIDNEIVVGFNQTLLDKLLSP